jgi:hypothetical protein
MLQTDRAEKLSLAESENKMKWSWKLGEVAGVQLRIHATFLLLLAWVGASHWILGRNAGAVVAGLLFIAALFGCVVLHELGHALTARRYGIRRVTLLCCRSAGLSAPAGIGLHESPLRRRKVLLGPSKQHSRKRERRQGIETRLGTTFTAAFVMPPNCALSACSH